MPLLKELSRTSQDSFESDSDSKESWDIRLNSSKSGICIFCLFDSIFEKRENLKMPLFGELSRSSRDSFESDSDSKESRDVRLYSPKSGISIFSSIFDSIDSIICSVRSIMCPGVDGDRPGQAVRSNQQRLHTSIKDKAAATAQGAGTTVMHAGANVAGQTDG